MAISVLVLLIGIDNPNINRTFPNDQFIVNDVFHDMGHFLLTEANTLAKTGNQYYR